MKYLLRWSASLLIAFGWIAETSAQDASHRAFIHGQVLIGTDSSVVTDAMILVKNGKIEHVGPYDETRIPDGTETVNLFGKYIIPGIINAHGHVNGNSNNNDRTSNMITFRSQLRKYASYGITTVVSLGGIPAEGSEIRHTRNNPELDHARLYVAGNVVTGINRSEIKSVMDRNIKNGVDIIKIRVDDNLGTGSKMKPEIYRFVLEYAHANGLSVAAHIYYEEDALDLLKSGVDFIAHSVRDKRVSSDFITMMKSQGIGYCPTLTRELSTYIYESRPAFFDDPFFKRGADPSEISRLTDPVYQDRIRQSDQTPKNKAGLKTALENLKRLSDAGVLIAFGTDSGPAGRFQGYFEHLEMSMMSDAGMSPLQILLSATRDAAASHNLVDLGTLEQGKWADFVVLDADPLVDIKNLRMIDEVYIAGNRVTTSSPKR